MLVWRGGRRLQIQARNFYYLEKGIPLSIIYAALPNLQCPDRVSHKMLKLYKKNQAVQKLEICQIKKGG